MGSHVFQPDYRTDYGPSLLEDVKTECKDFGFPIVMVQVEHGLKEPDLELLKMCQKENWGFFWLDSSCKENHDQVWKKLASIAAANKYG
jgi:hypothetical protein